MWAAGSFLVLLSQSSSPINDNHLELSTGGGRKGRGWEEEKAASASSHSMSCQDLCPGFLLSQAWRWHPVALSLHKNYGKVEVHLTWDRCVSIKFTSPYLEIDSADEMSKNEKPACAGPRSRDRCPQQEGKLDESHREAGGHVQTETGAGGL